jgi:Ser/Thr protein kinase RdoA (MazF antagonist)
MTDPDSADYTQIESLLNLYYDISPKLIVRMQYGNALCWKVEIEGEKLFFKKVRPDIISSEERFEEVIKVQNLLAHNDIPVVKPVPTKNGDLYFKDQESLYILYPFVSGITKSRQDLNDTNVTSLAKTLANIHLSGKGPVFQLSYQFKGWKSKNQFNDTAKSLIDLINQKEVKTELDEISIRYINAKSRIVNSMKLTFEELNLTNDHIIHGDYQENNVFFGEDDNVKWVIDLDTAQQSPRAREVARAIDMMCINRSDLTESGIRKARLFFKTYCEVYPMNSTELRIGFLAQFMKTSYSLFQFTEHYFNHGKNGEE